MKFLGAIAMILFVHATDMRANPRISVDENLEFAFALTTLTGCPENDGSGAFPLHTTLNFKLKDGYMALLEGFRSSGEMRYMKEVEAQGFKTYSLVSGILAGVGPDVDPDSEWIRQLPLSDEKKSAVVDYFRAFYTLKEKTGFSAAYSANVNVYNGILEKENRKVSIAGLINEVESFFRDVNSSYEVLFVTSMWPGGASWSFDGKVSILMGPKYVTDGLPDAGTTSELEHLIMHEFIHPFVGRLCGRNAEIIGQYSALYEDDRAVFAGNHVPDWISAVDETATRAVEVILCSGTQKELQEAVAEQEKLGFKYVPAFVEALGIHYLPYRDTVALDEVFPEILIATFSSVTNT